MTTALSLIKQEFGPDAVILSAKTLSPASGLLGRARGGRVAVTAAIDPAAVSKSAAEKRATPAVSASLNGAAPAQPRAARRMMAGLNQRVHTIYGRNGKPHAAKTAAPDIASTAEVVNLLVDQGVSADVASEAARQVAQMAPAEKANSIHERLARVITRRRLVGGHLRPAGDGPVVATVLGNAGAGKTTVVAKWAAIEAIDHGRRVGIVSLDDRRIGAGDQIATLARLIDVPVRIVASHENPAEILADWAQMDFVFIDTPGLSLNHPERYHRICRQLGAIPGLELHLVASATAHSRETNATIDRFDQWPVRSVMFTHLDACRFPGQLLDIAWTGRVPVSYASAGDIIPDDIQAVTADALAALVLHGDRSGLMTPAPEAETAPTIETTPSMGSDTPAAPPADPASAPFLANVNSDIFHRADCKWSAMIKPENTVAFHTTIEAGDKGFAPCRYCRPAEPDTVEIPRRVALGR